MTRYSPSPIPGEGSSSREQYIKNPGFAWLVCVISVIVAVILVIATVVAWLIHTFWFVVFAVGAVLAIWIVITVIYGWLQSRRRHGRSLSTH